MEPHSGALRAERRFGERGPHSRGIARGAHEAQTRIHAAALRRGQCSPQPHETTALRKELYLARV